MGILTSSMLITPSAPCMVSFGWISFSPIDKSTSSEYLGLLVFMPFWKPVISKLRYGFTGSSVLFS